VIVGAVFKNPITSHNQPEIKNRSAVEHSLEIYRMTQNISKISYVPVPDYLTFKGPKNPDLPKGSFF
jgi:hypothetical protein